MKIKVWFTWIIAGTVSLFLLIQLCFYFLFQSWNSGMRETLIEATANQTAEQVADLYQSVEDVSVDIMTDTYVLDYLYDGKSARKFGNYNPIMKHISALIFANTDIKYVSLLEKDNILLNLTQNADAIHCLAIMDEVRKDISDGAVQTKFIKAYQYKTTKCFAYVNSIRSLEHEYDPTHPHYIVILFELGEVESYLEPVFDRKKFTMRVLDLDDRILLSGHEGEFGQIFDPKVHATDSWYKTITMKKPEWKLCFSIPKTSFGYDNRSFLLFMLFVLVLNIVLLIVLIRILIKNISESISDIEREVGLICEGNWGHRIRYRRNNEIGSIAQSFNTLLDRYEEVISENSRMEEEMHKAKLLQLEAQIEQLQEKISPHFLYNSMEYIKGVAQEHGIDKIADITSVLSQNFRYNMDAGREATVKEDLFYAVSYFNVVNSRRKNPIRLQIQIPDEVLELKIIKMVFQPILENTLKHGDLGENGMVIFSGRLCDDGRAEILVKDNGQGIEPLFLEKLLASLRDDVNYMKDERGDHQGILNVHARLKLTYGDGCGISVRSAYGEWTEISVIIRYDKNK